MKLEQTTLIMNVSREHYKRKRCADSCISILIACIVTKFTSHFTNEYMYASRQKLKHPHVV